MRLLLVAWMFSLMLTACGGGSIGDADSVREARPRMGGTAVQFEPPPGPGSKP